MATQVYLQDRNIIFYVVGDIHKVWIHNTVWSKQFPLINTSLSKETNIFPLAAISLVISHLFGFSFIEMQKKNLNSSSNTSFVLIFSI